MVENNHTVNPNDCTCLFFIPRFSRDVLGRQLCPVSRLADPSWHLVVRNRVGIFKSWFIFVDALHSECAKPKCAPMTCMWMYEKCEGNFLYIF